MSFTNSDSTETTQPQIPFRKQARASCGPSNAKTREGESPGSAPPQTHCGAPGGATRRTAQGVQLRPELAGCPQDAPRAPAGCPPDASRMHPGRPQDASRMPPGCTTGAPRMHHGLPQDAPRMPLRRPQDAPRAPPGCSLDASRMPRRRPQDAPRIPPECPPGAPRMLPGCLQDAPRPALSGSGSQQDRPRRPQPPAASRSRTAVRLSCLGAERRTRRRPGVAGKPCRPRDPAAAPRRGLPPARACPAYTSLPASRAPSLRHHPSSSLSSRPFAAGETPASVWRPARRAGASPGKSLPLPGGEGEGGRRRTPASTRTAPRPPRAAQSPQLHLPLPTGHHYSRHAPRTQRVSRRGT